MGWIDVLATVLALALGLAPALGLALAHLQVRGSLAIDRRARLGGVNEPAESRYDTWEWRSLAAIAKNRAGMRCEDCGSDGPLDAHHIRPVGEGGAFWDLANLRALCRKCHQARHPGWVGDGDVDAGLDWWMAEGERMYAERMRREWQDSEAKSRQRRANAPSRKRASPYASQYPGFPMPRLVRGLVILVGLAVLIANLFTCVVALTY